MPAVKLPNQVPNELAVETASYLAKFPYSISVVAGQIYSTEFKEFHAWCEKHLGKKFKDWMLLSTGKTSYLILMSDSKRGLFLTLKYSEIVVSSRLTAD